MAEALRGLDAQEAAARLKRDGFNELEAPVRRTVWRIVWEVLREPMLQLLIAAGVVYVVLGDRTEALMLLSFVAITASITVLQERRAERVLESLRDLSSPRALVIRDGERQRIPGREVVLGDLLVLIEGDRVPADGQLITASDCRIDESLLTGESVPVTKLAPDPATRFAPRSDRSSVADPAQSTAMRPGGDGLPCVYGGTLVVGGQGVAEVTAVGMHSEIGRVGRSLSGIETEITPLQGRVRSLVKRLSVAGLGLSGAAALLYWFTRGDWLGGLLAGITLAMALLPEELPLILTVFMAMGSWRLSRQRVLTRRAAAIETLGSATMLCTDKTGTLTVNRMRVVALSVPEGGQSAIARHWAVGQPLEDAALTALLETGVLASQPQPVDPMERAFHDRAAQHAPQVLQTAQSGELTHAYGLSRELLAMTHVWCLADRAQSVVAAKGAPEAIIGLCRLDAAQAEATRAAVDALARRGMRVLGVACAEGPPGGAPASCPTTQAGFAFRFMGLVGLADPLRDTVPEAVRLCRQAGIRVAMITGDYPATAQAIAAQAGIDTDGDVITGDDIRQMDDAALQARVAHACVFARVMPEQKLRIVQALRAGGHIVAMTGDGVNDAPSLKAAHIGIAMGGRGTDVAREASDIVLLDDDFGSIVQAVRLGRRIDDNLRKAIGFIFSVHVPIAGLSLMPLLFGLPLLFSPIHVAFLELIIDPVASIVFEAEAEEPDLMDRAPRDPHVALLGAELIGWAVLCGAVVLLIVMALFAGLLSAGAAASQARASAFAALVLCNGVLVLTHRSLRASVLTALSRSNAALWRIAALTAVLLTAALTVPPLREAFRFELPTMAQAMAAAAAALLCLVAIACLQWMRNRLHASREGALSHRAG